MMMRSAKMKLTTPPKLMPPFQSTAARGTLPTEQTKLTTATKGPINGPQTLLSSGCPSKNSMLPERGRHPGCERPGDEKPEQDIAQDGRPLHHEHVRHRGEAGRRAQPLPQAPRHLDTHIHGGVTLHGTGYPLFRLLPGGVDHPFAQEETEYQGHQNDDEGAAHEFGQGELPGQKEREDDARARRRGWWRRSRTPWRR